MFCSNCGSQIPDGSAYCSNCGTPARREESQEQNNRQNTQDAHAGQTHQSYTSRGPVVQPKSRLGVTVGMLGAIIYFSALISPVILILLAAYVLLMEDDIWLKGTAVKAVAFYLVFFFIFQIIDGMNYFLNIINRIFQFLISWNPCLSFPGGISDLLSICRIVFFILMGLGAFQMRPVRIRKIDEFVETHKTPL